METHLHVERNQFNHSPCELQCAPRAVCPRAVRLVPRCSLRRLYTESVTSVFGRRSIDHHLFADDASTTLEGVDDVHSRLHDCTTNIASLRLELSENKTELACFGKRSRRKIFTNFEQTVTVGASVIQPAPLVRDLSVLLDQEFSITQHIAKVTSSCHTNCVDSVR